MGGQRLFGYTAIKFKVLGDLISSKIIVAVKRIFKKAGKFLAKEREEFSH